MYRIRKVLLFLNKCTQMITFYNPFNFHKTTLSEHLLGRWKVISCVFILISFVQVNILKAQTQIAAPVTLSYTSVTTAGTCGSTAAGGNYTNAAASATTARDAAFNTGGVTINIPAVSGLAGYPTTCYYWGFTTGTTGGIGGIKADGNSCATTPNNLSTPTLTSSTVLTVTGSAPYAIYNSAGSLVTATYTIRMTVTLTGATWGKYNNGAAEFYLAGPLNGAATANVKIEALYNASVTPRYLCSALTAGTYYPAVRMYDILPTSSSNVICTSFVPWFYTFAKPSMTSAATKTICSGAGAALSLTAGNPGSIPASYSWTVQSQSGVTGASSGSVGNGGQLNQALTVSSADTGRANYVVTPLAFLNINNSNIGTCAGTTQTVGINVVPIPTANTPSPNNPTICSATAPGIAMTSNTTGTTNDFTWTVVNNSPASGGTASSANGVTSINQTLSTTSAGPGTVVYTVTPRASLNSVYCSGSTFTQTVTVVSKPTLTVTSTPSDDSVCTGYPINLALANNTTGAGTNSWTWTATNGTNVSGATACSTACSTPINQTLTNSGTPHSTATYVITPAYTYNSVVCTGTAVNKIIKVSSKPTKPLVNGSNTDFTITFCGAGQLVSNIVRNDTTVKYYDSTGVNLLATGSVYNVTTPSLYKVLTYNINTGCYSDTVRVRVRMTAPFSTTVTKSNYNGYEVSCNGGSNGSITVAASTTAYPVVYTWSTGRTRTINSGVVRDSIIGTLAAGTYYISMSDASGCGKVDTVVLTSPPALSLSLTPSNYDGFGTNCSGSSTGSITATPGGGYGTYAYAWTSTPPGYTSTSGNISSLPAKTYNLTVTDGNSCTIAGSSVITDPNAITFTYSIGYVCSGSTYTSAIVTINASGGASGIYEYKMDAGSWQTSNQFTGLTNGSNHTFQVRDDSYITCLSATQNFTITFPPNGTSVGDCNYIYVTTGGAGNLGSKACPATLDSAFAIFSRTSARNHILMGSGTYTFNNTTIVIPGAATGLVIDGGYNTTTWIKSTATPTILNVTPSLVANAGEGHYTGIVLNGNNISLKDLTINVLTGGASGTTANRGRSIYGIYSNGRTGFLISRCAISTGAASKGNDGATHSGSGGGGAGALGGRNANAYAYGCSSCGSNGDNGDNAAGYGGGYGAGGAGGARCCAEGCNWYGCDADGCNNGNPGGNGQNGAPGTNGAAAAANTTGLGIFYTPVDGNDGANGKGGGGGGRGGEGASGTCCTCTCGPYFGTGGRGGDGGDGGLGGYKGYGGGSSFDIYVYGGSGVVTDCYGSAGAAGGGGSGSAGQAATGGTGGGAPGDNSGYCDGGRGAWGGAGGNGGVGGSGSNGAAGISARLQVVNGATVTGSGISGSAVPTDGTVTADVNRGCTKSQIGITKTSGSVWTNIATNPAFVLNEDSASTSYTTSTSNPFIYYTSTGVKNLSLGSTTLSNFISIYDTRLVDPVITVMSAISPNLICPSASISLGTTLTAPQIANITNWNWEISLVNDPFNYVYTSTSSAPGTVAAPVGGWELGELYQIRLQMKELCCGWSIPIYRTFRIFPQLAQPTITAVPSGTVCQNSTIKYYTAVAGATSYSWTVTGGTVVPGVSTDTIYVTWPTATTGTVAVIPKNSCTPNTDGPVRSINVAVNAIPSVSVSNSDPTICRPGSTTLTANAGSGGGTGNGSFTYIWSPGSSTANPITFTPSAAGTYTYTVQVTEGGSGCKVVSPDITVTADDAPSATPSLSKLFACDPSAVLLASSVTSGATIIWDKVSGTGSPSSSGSNPLTVTGLTGGATTIYDLLISKGNCDSLNMGSVSITAPSIGTTTIATASSCDYCVVTDGSTKSFYNSSGHIIATIVDDAAVTPNRLDTTEVCIGMMAYTSTNGSNRLYFLRRLSALPAKKMVR
jgi:hypothetical protein